MKLYVPFGSDAENAPVEFVIATSPAVDQIATEGMEAFVSPSRTVPETLQPKVPSGSTRPATDSSNVSGSR